MSMCEDCLMYRPGRPCCFLPLGEGSIRCEVRPGRKAREGRPQPTVLVISWAEVRTTVDLDQSGHGYVLARSEHEPVSVERRVEASGHFTAPMDAEERPPVCLWTEHWGHIHRVGLRADERFRRDWVRAGMPRDFRREYPAMTIPGRVTVYEMEPSP